MHFKTVVVIPTYNEAASIKKIVLRILRFHPGFNILVVDDNSPDGTGKIVEELAAKDNRIKILACPKKSGLGRAYLGGFRHVLLEEPPYERIIQMDADFSHSPRYLSDLINATQNTDISIGSRYIPQGRVFKWGLHRRILSYCANFYTRFWLNLEVKDCTSGFRCFRREVLTKIGLETIKSNGYMFQIELLTRCIHSGFSFKEFPITFVERNGGKSKLGIIDVCEAIFSVPRLEFLKQLI